MTCWKISEFVLFIEVKRECLIRKFPQGRQGGLQDTPAFVSSQSISLNLIQPQRQHNDLL